MGEPVWLSWRRVVLAAAAGGLLLAIPGCGAETQPPGATSAASQSPSASAEFTSGLGLVKVRYAASELVDGEESRIGWEVIADGDHRVRYTIVDGFNTDGAAIGLYVVWDGTTLLTYDPDGYMPYHRTTHPSAHEKPTGPILARPGSAAFTRYCPDGRRTGTRSVLGRTAVVYACDASQTEEGQPRATEMQLDEATGLVLKVSGKDATIAVTELVFNPPVTAETFSTALPAGVKAFEPFFFRLPAVGGGKVDTGYYVGQPLLVVTGDAAGIRAMVARLAPMTDKPIFGLLIAIPPPDWKGSLRNPADRRSLAAEVSNQAGSFPVPVAIDFKGTAATPISGPAGIPYGGTRPTAVGLVRSDQGLAKVLTENSTDKELRSQIAKLS
jgi:hypothetical protein